MDIKSEFKSILKRDKEWSRVIRIKNLPSSIRKTSEILSYSGRPGWEWIALVLIWLIGGIFWKEWAITVAIGLAILSVVQLAIKRLVNRDRPIGLWGHKTRKKDPDSFPSGHAARTFLLAILTTGLGPAWLAVVLWVWAILVSLSRVAMGVHFLSDVIGGLLLGIIVGVLWLHFHEGLLALLVSLSLRTLHFALW
jgi:undecaprenyl-diphosphatase